jgi:hypothetical protein
VDTPKILKAPLLICRYSKFQNIWLHTVTSGICM